ncbi:hypothetical protein [Micromonospora sp. HM5-17]|uniref:hypothetical protein n=1 Tax=Micromonospora sp. HM5-17 TaxID=2487710 RepID=UPI000F49B0D4|nr:hypothetical protein [Micromonospora sp. HM5-17]ROT29651.1 hypothetical protein EF879_18575 [Micromonospora sp. HM5-17]
MMAGRELKAALGRQLAASWARRGFLPEEAEPLIADGVTPATVREMEQYAEESEAEIARSAGISESTVRAWASER